MLKVYSKNSNSFNNNGLCVLDKAYDIKIHEIINAEYTLEFTLPRNDSKFKYIKELNFVKCEDQLFRIKKYEDTLTTVNVSCEHIFYDLSTVKYIPFIEWIGWTPAQILTEVLQDTPFSVGTVEISDPTDLIMSKTNPMEVIAKLIENVGGELLKDNYTINLLSKLGNETDIKFKLNKNINSIKRTTDATNVITRLYPYGKDDLDISTVNNGLHYIDSPLISTNGIKIGTEDFKDIEDPTELKIKALKKWSTGSKDGIDKPQISYKCDIIELKKLGLTEEVFHIGDTITIEDEYLNINTAQRITDYSYYPYEAQKSNVTLINYDPNDYITVKTVFSGINKTADDLNKLITADGNVIAQYVDNIQEKLQTEVNSLVHKSLLHNTSDMYVDNINDPTKAMLIGAGIFAIANSKRANGDWNWRTIGTGDRIVADEVDADWVYAGGISADQITAGTLSGITLNVDTNATVGKQLMIGSMQDASDKYIKFGDNMYIFTSSDGLNLTLHNYEGNISNAAIGDYKVTAQDTLQLTGLNGITLTTDKVSVGTTSGTEFNNEFVQAYLSEEDLKGTPTLSDGWTVNGSVYTHTTGYNDPLIYPLTSTIKGNEIFIAAFNYTGNDDFELTGGVARIFDENENCYKCRISYYCDLNAFQIIPRRYDLMTDEYIYFTGTFELLYIKKYIIPDCKITSFNNMEILVPDKTTIFIGGGGHFYNSYGNSYNTAIGYEALKWNTEGSYNVAIGSNALYNNTTGSANIAIGDSALSCNITGDDNIAIGDCALLSNETGNYNVAIGETALVNNTTGSYNVAVGMESLHDNTTGNYNVAIGDCALLSNETGNYNVAVGMESLHDNTTGKCNTAIGYKALLYNETGSNNIAVGCEALLSNETGSNNIAIGYECIKYNTTGNYNTAVGNYALYFNTTGNHNTAVGINTLLKNTTGSNNTVVGKDALYYNTTGNYNTAVGNYALYFNTTGKCNTAIGYSAGAYDINSNNNEGSDYSIYIGKDTKSSSVSAQNEIVIGYNARGYGNNTAHIGNSSVASISFGAGTGTAFTNRSDRRIKEDIIDADTSICYNDIKNLPLHRFKYKDFVGNEGDKHLTGFIADEFEKTFPKAVFKKDHAFPVLDENGNKVMKTITEEITEVIEDEEKVKEIKAKYAVEKTKERKEMTEEEKAAIKLAKEKEKEELKAATKTITKTVEKQVEETFVIEQCASIDTSQLTPTIVGCIQKLIEKVEALENEIAILKGL